MFRRLPVGILGGCRCIGSSGGSSDAGGASAALSVFDSISLDGYFTDGSGDTSWAQAAAIHGSDSARERGWRRRLLFGRKTTT
jgi:hypothetical protein